MVWVHHLRFDWGCSSLQNTHRVSYLKRRKKDFEEALKTIRHEQSNFQQIADAQVEGREFGGYHQRAVEVYSYEKTLEALTSISEYFTFNRIAKRAIREVESNQGRDLSGMNVQPLQHLLTQIEEKLERECQKIKLSEDG